MVKMGNICKGLPKPDATSIPPSYPGDGEKAALVTPLSPPLPPEDAPEQPATPKIPSAALLPPLPPSPPPDDIGEADEQEQTPVSAPSAQPTSPLPSATSHVEPDSTLTGAQPRKRKSECEQQPSTKQPRQSKKQWLPPPVQHRRENLKEKYWQTACIIFQVDKEARQQSVKWDDFKIFMEQIGFKALQREGSRVLFKRSDSICQWTLEEASLSAIGAHEPIGSSADSKVQGTIRRIVKEMKDGGVDMKLLEKYFK